MTPLAVARVLTWNLERKLRSKPRGAEADAYLFGLEPDVVVATEARKSIAGGEGFAVWADPPRGTHFGEGERKVGLWSRYPWTEVGECNHPDLDPTRFVSGVTETPIGPVRMLGLCIPYAMAEVTYPVDVKHKPWELHMVYLEALTELLASMAVNASDLPLVVAGDFNQRIPRTHAPHRVSEALTAAFQPLTILTQGVVDGCEKPGIDHIAISGNCEATRVWGWPNDVTGNRLSDHDGAGAELQGRAS